MMFRVRSIQASSAVAACVFALMLTALPLYSQAQRKASETTALVRAITERVPPATPQEPVDGCPALLKQEMASPSIPMMGEGGGPIDSGYLQAVIVGSVCTYAQKGVEREAIRKVVAERLEAVPATDNAMHDRLTIILGLTGDPSAVAPVMKILDESTEWFLRAMAATALGEINDRKAIPALQRAMLNDNHVQIRFGDCLTSYDVKHMVFSPTRLYAAEILRLRMGVPVPDDVEVLDRSYGVARLEPLLYMGDAQLTEPVIDTLAELGGPQAQQALTTFIDKSDQKPELSPMVSKARSALAKMSKD